ncbi:MAG: type II toxin-antitoxin system VapC family toxin [Xanthomonadales bacterium]|nr:type II toxin-antitoxin system VapC family toxin [Xanthomonadales bacterium]
MIVLDTNVISEPFKPVPNPKVIALVGGLPNSELYTTAVTRGELLFGAYCLPDGQRKNDLLSKMRVLFVQGLADHVLPYDSAAAEAQAAFAAMRRTQGRRVQLADAMIAGIALSRGARLATRNTRDFEGCGIALIDPWQ